MAPEARGETDVSERERQAAAREKAARVKLAGMDEQEIARMELHAEAIGEAVGKAVTECLERAAKSREKSSDGREKRGFRPF